MGLLLAGVQGLVQAGPAMDNETVVRMTVQGESSEAIVRVINDAVEVDFDLDRDMVVELRRAGVADIVIEAMREAMLNRRPDEKPSSPDPVVLSGRVGLAFQDDDKLDEARNSIILPGRNRDGEETTLAFYLFCVEPTHAPHMWQSVTPLTVNFTRHHMIWFHEGTASYRKNHVYLEKPEHAVVETPAGRHLIRVGVAARSGESDWLPVTDAAGVLEVKQGETVSLVVRLRTRRGRSKGPALPGVPTFECEILDPEKETGPGAG